MREERIRASWDEGTHFWRCGMLAPRDLGREHGAPPQNSLRRRLQYSDLFHSGVDSSGFTIQYWT